MLVIPSLPQPPQASPGHPASPVASSVFLLIFSNKKMRREISEIHHFGFWEWTKSDPFGDESVISDPVSKPKNLLANCC